MATIHASKKAELMLQLTQKLAVLHPDVSTLKFAAHLDSSFACNGTDLIGAVLETGSGETSIMLPSGEVPEHVCVCCPPGHAKQTHLVQGALGCSSNPRLG